MIRILIADDHHLFRQALARILSDARDIEVTAAVADGGQAVRKAMEDPPDLILMDVNMPRVDGLEATRRLSSSLPQIPILMLTVSNNEEHLFAAIRAGARGYLLKNASTEELFDAVRRVCSGEAIVSPTMAVKLLEEFAALSPGASPQDATEELTGREREVLQHLARGLSNKEIASRLNLSPHTVKTHLARVFDKLHLHSRTEAALWAARHRF